MTVSAVTPRVKYNGSGSTGPFSIPFYWLNTSELVVTKTSSAGVESTLVVTTNYTVTGAGTDTGALTLITTLAVGETLVIERSTTQTQGVDMTRSVIDPEILEGALDKLLRLGQDVSYQASRSLRLYKDDTTGSGVFNAGGQRIGNLGLGVDPTDAATMSQVEAVTGSIATAEAAAAAAEASAVSAAFYADLAEGVAAASILPNTFALSGDVTPATITSNQNNYNPTGWSTASVLRLSSDATRNITGLAGGADGRFAFIHNVGSFQIVLKDDDAASTATNRFALPRETAVAPDQCVFLQYDSTASRWKLIGGNANRVLVAPSAPSSPSDGDLWFDNAAEILYVWISPSWLDVSTLTTPGADSISNTELANMAALTVKGNATNATADPSDIAAASDGQVLRRSGTTLGFGTVATAGIADDAITNAKLANVATSTIKGRLTAATGDPEDLTPEQAQAVLLTQPFASENKIINGAMDFWQRGTSSATAGYQTADRWKNEFSGGTDTMSRQSFTVGTAFGRNTPKYYLRHAISGHSLSSHYARVHQRIENVSSYAGQTITILGWATRSSGTGNMAVEVGQNFGTGGSPSSEVTGTGQTVTLTGSWAAFAITVSVPSISGKTLGSNNDDYMYLNLWTSAGTDHNTRAASLGLQTINVDLWGVHIRVGTHTAAAAASYIAPELGPELARCQRYYWLADYQTASFPILEGYGQASTNCSTSVLFPVVMRTKPTMQKNGTWNVSNCGQPSADLPTSYGFALRALVTASAAFLTHMNSSDDSITADAEL
jgi:hypothetical protein